MLLDVAYTANCVNLRYTRVINGIGTKKEKKVKSKNGRGRGEENAVKASVFNFRRKKENLEAAD